MAAIPGKINYQGYLTDNLGNPLDGTYTITFKIYSQASGGTELWNPPNGETQTVTVYEGVYNVQLGSEPGSPLDKTIFGGGEAWLEVTILNPDTSLPETLGPRLELTSSAYTFQAANAETLENQSLTDLDSRYVEPGETASVNSVMISDGTVTAADLGANSVYSSEIASGAVASSEVLDNSLTANDLASGSVGNSELANNSVTSAKILDGTITAADLGTNSVYSSEIGTGAVASSEVLDNSLTASDLASGSVGISELATSVHDIFVNETGDSMTGRLDVTSYLGGTAAVRGADQSGTSEFATGYLGFLSPSVSSLGLPYNPVNIGVLGVKFNAGSDGVGVYAWNNDAGLSNYAMYSVADGASGTNYGIYARADNGTSSNYGGYFTSSTDSSKGVYSLSSGLSGRAVEGYASNTGSSINYGGYFRSNGSDGRGVYGNASNSGNYYNYGGYFQASGTYGRGVYGYANGASGNGVYGYSTGDYSYGVYANSSNGDGLYARTGASNEHAGYFNSSVSDGLAGATLYARAYNSGAPGIAFWAHNDHTTSTDATAVLSNDGSGPLLKGFGANGGEDEFRINNDGTMLFYNNVHSKTIEIKPEDYTGGSIFMYNDDGDVTIDLDSDYSGNAGHIAFKTDTGITTVQIYGNYSGTGDGRIITDELQITGGSDLSEQFDVKPREFEVGPGMVVSIDPENPGNLQVSTSPYDKKVAGIISGANGIKTGMMMGQKGTEADGQHPVALTGRVYCKADASKTPIKPGDLLTTSTIPGHAMKVSNYEMAQGSIIGKAMTPLAEGKGLVLVLVTLQ